jgi:hypothetical protein
MTDPTLHIWAATSGWEGPFQHEEVIVVAPDLDGARHAAERAFSSVTQPVCRAKMRIADLGPVAAGIATAPRRSGETFTERGEAVNERCDPPAQPPV